MEKILAGVIAGVFVGGIGHFFGVNAGLAIIGSWVFLITINKSSE